MPDAINIEGSPSQSLSVSTSAVQSDTLERGIYDVYCDVDVFIKVDEIANDVTIINGYKIFTGNVVPVNVQNGRRIGAIAGADGTLRFQKVG